MITDRIARVGFAMLVALGQKAHGGCCRVLDFGGGAGNHFDTLRQWIKTDVDWVVCETPSMASRAATVCAGKEGLRFVAALEAGQSFDVVLASSALQYVRDPPRLSKARGRR